MYVRYAHQLLSSIALDIQVVSTGKLFDFSSLGISKPKIRKFRLVYELTHASTRRRPHALSILAGKFRNLLRQEAKP